MYVKPELQKFGTMRELTLLGASGDFDGTSIFGSDGCSTFGIELGCPRS